VTVVGTVVGVVVVVFVAAVAIRRGLRRRPPEHTERRLLVPFTGGMLDPTVLSAAIRIARAETATLVPAYLLVVPRSLAEDAPATEEVAGAMPWLEAVELEALKAGVQVDARIEKGRTPTHALSRLWDVEPFDRVIAPAPTERATGFTPKDIGWILMHAPIEALVLRPAPRVEHSDSAPTGANRPPGSRLLGRPSGRSVTLSR
jgi:hypothetical protein